jgi:predicted RNA binding protein YcfA (HicA-like mRNA interferase family)
MSKPTVTAQDIHRLLNHFGDYALKKNCGSCRKHQKFIKIDGTGIPVVIPIHSKQKIKKGTLQQIVEAIAENEGLSIDEVWKILSEV